MFRPERLDLRRHSPAPAWTFARFLLTSLAGVLAAPLAAEGQQTGKVWRIADQVIEQRLVELDAHAAAASAPSLAAVARAGQRARAATLR